MHTHYRQHHICLTPRELFNIEILPIPHTVKRKEQDSASYSNKNKSNLLHRNLLHNTTSKATFSTRRTHRSACGAIHSYAGMKNTPAHHINPHCYAKKCPAPWRGMHRKHPCGNLTSPGRTNSPSHSRAHSPSLLPATTTQSNSPYRASCRKHRYR